MQKLENAFIHFVGTLQKLCVSTYGCCGSCQVCLCFNAQSTMIATGSMDRTAKLWDIESGAELATLSVQDLYVSLLVYPFRTVLVTNSFSGTHGRDHLHFIQQRRYTPSDRLIRPHCGAMGCKDGQVSILGSFFMPLTNRRKIHTLIGHRAEVSSAQMNYEGSLVVSGSMDKTAKVWDAESGKCIATLRFD
jgi:dynein assembly factor with WDR repeat domains 1